MGFLEKLRTSNRREAVIQMLLALGTFAAMPAPEESLPLMLTILVVSEWILTALWAWSLVFEETLSRTLWLGAFVLSLVLLFKLQWFLHPLLLLLFPMWKQARELRLRQQKAKKSFTKVLAALLLFAVNVSSSAQDEISEAELKAMEAEMGDMSEFTKPTKKKKKKKVEEKAAPKETTVEKTPTPAPTPAPTPTSAPVTESEPVLIPNPAQDAAPTTSVESSAPNLPTTGELPLTIGESEKVEIPEIKKIEVLPQKIEAKPKKNEKLKSASELEESEDPSHLSRKEKSKIMREGPKPGEIQAIQEKEKQKDVTLSELPKYLTGYEVIDFSSCSVYDQIPWKFSPDKRKKRLLLKDKLRHQTETIFKTWEVHQVMDPEGFVSYIFRNAMADGRYDSIVIKDTIYNRFIETAKGKKQIELQDLKSLVNRQALAFYTQNGSTIALMPSTIGKSALVIQQGRSEGRVLPPIFIRGNTCDRPDDDENADQKGKVDGAGEKGIAPVKK